MHSLQLSVIATSLAIVAPALAHSDKSDSSDISWISPGNGDLYTVGSTLTAQWTSQKKVVSPSFKLCDNSGCGDAVWPDVKESDGAFSSSVAIPDSMPQSAYYLQMKDDFGNITESPQFNISSSSSSITDSEVSDDASSDLADASEQPDEPGPPVDHTAQQASGGALSSNLDGQPNSGHASDPFSHDPIANEPSAQAPLAVNSPSPNTKSYPGNPSPSISGSAPYMPSSSTPSPLPQPQEPLSQSQRVSPLAATHTTPPAVAIAVPLSLAGAILLVAGLMAVHHRRHLVNEQAKSDSALHQADTSRLLEAISRRSTLRDSEPSSIDSKQSVQAPSNSTIDLEKALLINALLAEKQQVPALPSVYDHPPYSTAHIEQFRHFRQRTRDAFSFPRPNTSLSASPLYISSLAEPSLRRQPEHSSATYTSAPPAPSARSPEKRQAVGPGEASVTEGFLPSYLPSPVAVSKPLPNTASPKFEDISLSPRIPLALHVRSVPPLELDERSSMKSEPSAHWASSLRLSRSSPTSEQRTLYDAVARALGTR